MKEKILNGKCAWCNQDLTSTKSQDFWALALINFCVPCTEKEVSMGNLSKPQLEENLKFCSLFCLKKWINKEK